MPGLESLGKENLRSEKEREESAVTYTPTAPGFRHQNVTGENLVLVFPESRTTESEAKGQSLLKESTKLSRVSRVPAG